MPQLSLYLDEDTMNALRRDANVAGLSLSKYVSRVLQEQAENKGWPEGWFDLYGSLADDDSFQEPEDLPYELDRPIPTFDED